MFQRAAAGVLLVSRARIRWSWGGVAAVLLLLGTGCHAAEDVAYRPSWGSWRVAGRVILADAPTAAERGDALVLVYLAHELLVSLSDDRTSSLKRTTARVLRPDAQGRFWLALPGDVLQIQLWIIAPGHETRRQAFRHQPFFSEMRFEPKLRATSTSAWRNAFYVDLNPRLQALIVDPRYELSESEQLALGAWLAQQQDRLADPR